MVQIRGTSLLLVLALGTIMSGCKPAVVAPPAVAPATAGADSGPDSLTSGSGAESPTKTENPFPPVKGPAEATEVLEKPSEQKPVAHPIANGSGSTPRPSVLPFKEAAFLPSEIVGLAVVHPKQLFESALGKLAIEMGFETDSGELAELLKRMNLKLSEIERVTLFIDQALVNKIATENGIPVSTPKDVNDPEVNVGSKQQELKQVGLAFHNYHDVNGRFPRADGDASGKNTGLSWRVHLLPYLDQAPLYNLFRMNEPWDSEHNKALIEKMPPIFRSPGVTDTDKTTLHVLTGEKTIFHGDEGPAITSITDGTSNTILAVLAAADTAEIWTKPGGLDVDWSAPGKALGDLNNKPFLALFADGFVREIPATIDETFLAHLIQPADGNVVDFVAGGFSPPPPPPLTIPPTILFLSRDANQMEMVKGLLGESTVETHEGASFYLNQDNAVWFSENRTLVVGSIESVKKMISTKQSGKPSESPLISELQLGADFTAAVDVKSQSLLTGFLVQLNPMMGMISNIKTAAANVSVNGKEGESLIELNVTAIDAALANGMMALATMGVNQGKMAMSQIPEAPNANASDKEMQKLMKQIVGSATVKQTEDKIQFRIPTPSGFDRVPTLLRPTLINARAAAKDVQKRNSLRMVGLAFHNYHDVFGTFPGAGRARPDAPSGLSWRVHLLPFLDQAPLYAQFKQDEAWDSEHNKSLIEKMPPVFKSPGVDDVGKTSVHVFTGAGAPFADEGSPSMRQFTDGTSNTLLAVIAGPNTAEFWTKPGGLDFDPKDPIKSLGNLIEDSFVALLADGSVRLLTREIDPQLLSRIILISDGEPVTLP